MNFKLSMTRLRVLIAVSNSLHGSEAKLIESGAKTKSDEFLNYVADIEKDRQRYQQIIEQLPNVADFSEEELEKKNRKS